MLEKREGILLFAIPYLGQKKILKVFTAEEGLLSLIAKSAKDAWITPFFLAEWVYQKGEKEIHPLKDITLLDPFLELKADYSRITQAGQIAQDLLASQFPSKKSHGLYELAVAYFKKLPLFSHPEVATASFRLKLLQYEGLLSLQKKCCLCPSSPLHLHQGKWEEKVKLALQGLKNGAMREVSLPGPSFKGSLFPYQQKGVDWLSHLYKWGFSALLADEMGLGKTVQVLAFFSRLRTNLPVLIVAPSSLLYNWLSEIKRFLGVDAYLHAGPERLTQKSELQNLKIVITSYAILRLDEAVLKEVEFEVVALDEAGAIKTAATQTARAAYQLKSRFRISITGTPIENRMEELQSQFRFLMPELSSDKRNIRPFLMRRRKEEVQIDLPEKIEQIVWVEMDEGQRKVLEEFRKGVNLSGRRMEILEAILRLRQICADPRLIGIDLAGAKIERLLQDLEEMALEKRKVLVFSQFTSMLQLIALELKQKALYLDGSTPIAQREAIVRSFQEDPEQLIFLISLKAGGVGLNLTAADTVILFDPWWNQAVENQAIDRAHRIGQKKTVIAKRYLIPNSIEEKMLKIKEKKQAASDEIFQEEGGSWSEAELLQLLED